jgi:elongation factor Tu
VVDVDLFKRRSKDLFTIPGPGRAAADIEPAASAGFRMAVADVFVIANRGTVVVGTVEAGAVALGTPVTIERAGRPPLAAAIAAIELARKKTKQAGTGDSVGLLFRGLTRGEIAAGDVVRT